MGSLDQKRDHVVGEKDREEPQEEVSVNDWQRRLAGIVEKRAVTTTPRFDIKVHHECLSARKNDSKGRQWSSSVANKIALCWEPLRNPQLRGVMMAMMHIMLDQRTTLVVWVLFMLLFIAINAHAAVCCYKALHEEWRTAKIQKQLCSRKRRRVDYHNHHHLGLAITSDQDTVAVEPATWILAARLPHRKRRRLSYRHHLAPRMLRREATPWPWPVHISFHSLTDICDTTHSVGSVVAAFLNHHLVVACVEKLQELLRNALEEMLVSCLSFVLCACVVLLLRTYSSLVVGVSVDLGAFSVDI